MQIEKGWTSQTDSRLLDLVRHLGSVVNTAAHERLDEYGIPRLEEN